MNKQDKLCVACTCTPGSATSNRAKKEEEALATILLTAGFVFQREQRISFNCFTTADMLTKLAKLDFLIEVRDKRVILECDERQHKDIPIKSDLSRMMHVMTAIRYEKAQRPTLWIRFNPGDYSVDGKKQHCNISDRYSKLVELIQTHKFKMDNACPDPMNVVYMYYDTTNGYPDIFQHPRYSDNMKRLVLPCII